MPGDPFEDRVRQVVQELLTDRDFELPFDSLPQGRLQNWLEGSLQGAADELLYQRTVGAASIGTLPSASLMHTAGYSTGANAWTTFLLGVKEWDTDRMLDPAGNPGKIYCKTRGFYLLTGQVFFAADADGVYRLIGIDKNRVNAGPLWAPQNLMDVGTGANASARGSTVTILPLNVGDYVVFNYYQDSGGALAVNSGGPTDEDYLRFSAHWLGDYASDKLR